jgi:hypothetical protein
MVPTFYLLFLWPFLTPGFFWPLAIWCSYGLARSVLLWRLAWTAPPGNPLPTALSVVTSLTRRSAIMHRAHAYLLLLVAVWLLGWRPLL